MSRDEIVSAMTDAGLVSPRVLPVLLRNGTRVFDLYAGETTQRVTTRVPVDANKKAVTAAIDTLRPA